MCIRDRAYSQHKHKIKHDKTTMQSYLSMPGGIRTSYGYSDIHKQLQADLHIINKCGEAFVYCQFVPLPTAAICSAV